MNDIVTYFFEAHFNQDWTDDYVSSLDAVKAFSLDEPIESKNQLKSALLYLQSKGPLPQDAINKLGENFKPETEGITTDVWLQRVLETLADQEYIHKLNYFTSRP